MPDEKDLPALDAPPDADTIASLREQAADREESVGVTFPTSDGVRKRFIVSPRGTGVLLQNMREDTFNPSVTPETIAEAVRE